MNEYHPTPEFEEQVRQAMDVPSADPAFVEKLGMRLVSRPARTAPRPNFRPAWIVAMLTAMAMLALAVPSVAAAIGRLFGYVPGQGLVENTGNLRMLAAPVSIQRQSITLTITNALVYPDRIELLYRVDGLSPENDGYQAVDAVQDPTAFCGGVKVGETASKDGDARLKLPDGTMLERDYTGLYPQNAYAMSPVYKAALPSDVTELSLVLKCIPGARLAAVPGNWELPFKLVAVPAGAIVGQPVYTIQPPTQAISPATQEASPESGSAAALGVTMTLEKIAPTSSGMVFYFRMEVANPDPSLQSIVPARVYMLDSAGQQIPLTSAPIYPVQHPLGSLFEYFSTVKPAPGPVTLVIEDAVAYYAPLYVEPQQATPEEMSFTFDAGASPQPGQVWHVDKSFEIGKHSLQVTSVRAVTFADIDTSTFIDGSQGYDHGYQFTVHGNSVDKLSVQMDILSNDCWLYAGHDSPPDSTSVVYTELCRNGYPTGTVTVTLSELSLLVENTWQATWSAQ